tara:strand:- start:343 stop:510 length:168 start_codon:yes stop_codon:yes gene_type:complete
MLSRLMLLKNSRCCGEGCFMCPYEPRHDKNSRTIRKEVIKICTKEELNIINNLKS